MTTLDCRPVLDDGFSPAIGQWRPVREARRGGQVRLASRWLDVELSWALADGRWAVACSGGVLLTAAGSARVWLRTPDQVWAIADAQTRASLRALETASLTEVLLGETSGPGVDGEH